MPGADCYLVKTALTGVATECGDTGLIVSDEGGCFVALVDVLGHGKDAAAVALEAESYLRANCRDNLVDLMQGLHEHLKGSRGAVAFLARLDTSTGELRYTGIGNIGAKVFGADDPVRLPSKDGVVGYMMSTPKEQRIRLFPRDLVALASDGIREHFELFDYPGLLNGSAEQVAHNMLRKLSKGDDDASCLVLRYLK